MTDSKIKMAVYLLGFVLFIICFVRIDASYHWVVTESGKIQTQVDNSGFPLTKPDDLFAIFEQEERVSTLKRLHNQLMVLKNSIDTQWFKVEADGELEKKLYSSDIDCLLGEIPLSQHNLNTEFLNYGLGSRPKMREVIQIVQPDCTAYSDLDFSMRTFPHLDTLNQRSDFNLKVDIGLSKAIFDFSIDAMLKRNSSDWTAYNIASLYWRSVGNATNALECARRALYYSPIEERYVVLVNLGTLLQELHSLGEAAIVLHSAVDHDPVQDVSHLALGNVYAALGDYRRSLACYDNVLNLNPGNLRAFQLKHALLCHRKLESRLLNVHSSLHKILQDLQIHNSMLEEWLILQNRINWETDSKEKEFFALSQPIYLNLRMLLQSVEHQAKALNKEVNKRVSRKNQLNFQSKENLPSHCETEGCTETSKDERIQADDEPEDSTEDEGELENLDNSEFVMKNRMSSLMTLIKANYKDEESLINFKNKINRQIDLLKELTPGAHLTGGGGVGGVGGVSSSEQHTCFREGLQ